MILEFLFKDNNFIPSNFISEKKHYIMKTLLENQLMKSRSGVYSDTAENRRKHRVGQKYGAEKQPEDGEKTEKKETEPAKELEAVNKVIAAVNEGKLKLPEEEKQKLYEKKHSLEKKVKGDKKEEKNSENKNQKDSLDENLVSKKKELKNLMDRKYLYVAKNNLSEYKDKVERLEREIEKIESDVLIERNKTFDDVSKDSEQFSRVQFEETPNSEKVNIKKYLSDKLRKEIDDNFKDADKISTNNLKRMEKGLVEKFNNDFDSMSKSQRAKNLYNIMKIKNELVKRNE